MALSYAKLSGSTDGKPIPVTGTTTGAADTIHTVAGAAVEQIWLWAVNVDTVSRDLTIEWGAAGDGNLAMKTVPIPALSGLMLVVPGLPLANSLVVKAFASAASKINLMGHVLKGI